MIEIVSEDLLEEAKREYDRNGMAFHNWTHVEFCLDQLARYGIRAGFFVPVEARLALVFHDIVYVPGRKDNENEKQSIVYAASILAARAYSAETVERVREFIGYTSHQISPEDCDIWSKAVCDADYAILGQPEAEYKLYASRIAEEFFSIPAREFLDGRIRFLSKRLTRPIFQTRYFSKLYEDAAKRNMRDEMESLNRSLDA